MPCNSDHMRPNAEEENRRLLARLIIYTEKKLGFKPPKMIVSIMDDVYGKGKLTTDQLAQRLCGRLSKMDEKQLNRIVYNAHIQDSRDLATWWDEHQKADEERIKEEKRQKNKAKAKTRGLKKLTPTERAALGV